MTSDNYAGVKCGDNEICEDGKCRCETGYLKCDGKCISVMSDTSCGKTESCDELVNCQERGLICDSTEYKCTCPKNYLGCDGECINPKVSGTHCGARGSCTDDSEKSLDYKGDNCAEKGEVCKVDTGAGGAKCTSNCPEGLINCKGECVDQEEYHLNVTCTGCHADYCYTGRVDEKGKPIDFNYRLCKSVDTNGVDNKKNSSRFCNGCNVVPYRDDLGENDATSCPPSMYCTGESGLYRCDCKPGTTLCKIPVEGSSDLKSACIPSDHLKECSVDDNGNMELTCEDGWKDCNGDPTDGCETNLNTSVEHCGVCETNCLETTKGAFGQTCNEGKCDYALCLSGYGDCNDDRTDGCEVDVLSNKEHCGACSKTCEGEYCNNSICYYGDGAENIPSSAECVEGTKKYYYQYDIWKACFGNNRFGCFKNKSVCWSEVN